MAGRWFRLFRRAAGMQLARRSREGVRRNIVQLQQSGFVEAREIAVDRAQVGGVVVVGQQFLDQRFHLPAIGQRVPARDLLAAVQRHEAIELLVQRRRIGREVRVILHQQRTRLARDSVSEMHDEARIVSISAAGTRSWPTFLLSDSTNTGSAGSKRRSWSQIALSKAFCDGCGWLGKSPSTEPRCAASCSRSSTCAPCAASTSSKRLLPLPVVPQTTWKASAGATSSAALTWLRKAL